MGDIYKRGISGLVYVLLFTSSILYSEESYLFITYFFGLACLREFMRLIRLRNYIPYLLFSGLTYLLLFERALIQLELFVLGITNMCSIYLLVELFVQKETYRDNLFQKFVVTIFYLVFSLFFLMYLPFYDGEYQASIVLSVVVMIWVNDSFAYLVGKNFGKHKLFPSVSPKKTIEGFVGGVLFTLGAAYCMFYYVGKFSLTHWIVIGAITAILGTFGDLVESRFKRLAKVKDSGHIMPGHGGLLDRLDSLFFVAPFVYLYIHFII